MKKVTGLFIGTLCLLMFCLVISYPVNATDVGTQKAVLVTGSSTGIGRKITDRLAVEGFLVYAGARKSKDIDALNQIENVEAVRLDVTIQKEIDQAVKQIEAGGLGLYGVVNNAGVLGLGSLIEVDESELDFIFNVNVYGPYRITKAFAPMIVESQGRVINISSISGVLSGDLAGVYSMSKHAIEAYTDSLDRELRRLGARAIAIEPGTYDSKIFNNLCDRLPKSDNGSSGSLFEKDMEGIADECEMLPAGEVPNNRYQEPDRVADAVFHALSAVNPKEHYMVVPNQDEARQTISKAIEELVSLNEDHEFSYSRDELIESLDKEMASRLAAK